MAVTKKKTINFQFGEKHKAYIRKCIDSTYNIAEGAVRAGKTVDNIFAFAHELKTTKDRIHLATGSTSSNAKLNIGDANGFGLEHIFRGQCRWGEYKGNECLYIRGSATNNKQRIVIFAGGAKKNSYAKIRGNSYGMWIATEINLHHDKTIKEAFNRLVASNKRKIFWDLNPDNPNAFIYTEYIDNYKEKDERGELLGGYNYQHFTIHDNITVTEERKKEILTQYDVRSIWYKRDILGQRCVAEGLIYRLFADNREEFKIKEKISGLMEINIGVDFGGTGSGHSFVATGITRNYKDVIALSSERHFGEIDPDRLGLLFVEFCLKIVNVYGFITCVYCDSAEQVLIRGLRSTAKKNGLGWLKIVNAYKSAINDRISLVSRLIAQGRFKYTNDCKTLEVALCSATWDSKEITKNVRLDNGSSDIDTLDAFEYSIEKHTTKFIKYE